MSLAALSRSVPRLAALARKQQSGLLAAAALPAGSGLGAVGAPLAGALFFGDA